MGNFTRSLERGLQIGSRIRGQRDLATDRRNQLLEAREARMAKLRAEAQGQQAFTDAIQTEQKQNKSRSDAFTTVQTFADLARLPKSIRGPQIDVFVQEYEQKFQQSLAPNVVDFLKKGSTEDVLPFIKGMMRKVSTDPDFNMETLGTGLGNPRAASQQIIGLNQENQSIAEGSAKAASTEQTPQQKAQLEMSRLEKRREALTQALPRMAGTRSEASANKVINRIDKRIKFLQEGASPIGQLAEDRNKGLITDKQMEAGIKREIEKGNKRRVDEFVISILDKLKRGGKLTRTDLTVINVARRFNALSLFTGQQILPLLNKGNTKTQGVGSRSVVGSKRPKVSGSRAARKRTLENKLMNDNPGFSRTSKEIQDAVKASLKEEGL